MKALQLLRASTIVFLLTVNPVTTFAVTITTDTYIGATNLSNDGEDLVVTNCTLTVDGPHGFNSLQIQNGGVLTHSAFTNGPGQSTYSISNEAQTLSVSNPATLLNTNVDTHTIVVMDASGTITYTANVDYVVLSVPPYTQLELTTNSAIAEGTNVLVSYNWIQTYQGFSLIISNDMQVLTGGTVNLNGKGYANGNGYGNGGGGSQATNYPFAFTAGGGGGHGGCGGISSTFARGGGGYDSTTNPAIPGSSGGTGSSAGGAGGGAGQLFVGGTLQVDGQIVAGGLAGTNSHSGGGAGGTILLSAQTFSGAGTISAQGGAGDPPDGGGGGGGRIAIYFVTNSFTGSISAFGGAGVKYGGAGTIFTQSLSNSVGDLLIVNGGTAGTNTLFMPSAVGTLTISGDAVAQPQISILTISNLFIDSNSSLVAPLTTPLTITINGDATIESNGAINLNFNSASGAGAGGYNCNVGTGGGYGGFGGTGGSCGRSGGGIYGSITQPFSLGSPGGLSVPAFGGGAIHLTVAGTLSLAGKISSDGARSVLGSPNGAGSGGSVWLTVGTLAGNGLISANGGTADTFAGGGGGGGRIAVYFDTNLFTGNMLAHGGMGAGVGGPGTVYVETNRSPFGQLTIDNGGLPGPTALFSGLSAADLTISGGAIVTNFTSATDFLRNLVISSKSFFAVSPLSSATIGINATNVTVQSGGGIIADGASTEPSGGSANFTGGGGGNGGIGGISASNAPGGASQGSLSSPQTPGGEGGYGANGLGGSGGGAVILTAGSLQLDGTITANGMTGSVLNSGGGAGGSINLTVGTFSGGGTISANGGNGNNGIGGGGGGGRVAVHYSIADQFAGVIVAHGGIGGQGGGAGTVDTINNLGQQQLVIDNGNIIGAKTPLPQTESGSFDLLSITGGAWVSNATPTLTIGDLFVGSNGTFQAGYSSLLTLEISSNATVQSGGLLTFDGGNASGTSGLGQTLNSTGGGGSYAGIGGTSLSNAAGGAAIFDSLSSPAANGGRGGPGNFGNAGGNGGGSWNISVNGTLQLDGKISAEGTTGSSMNSGGGAGGSISLSVGTIAGSGHISVNGGAANGPAGGGGGGGRIALHYNSNLFTGSITANGGAGGHAGGAGTIYTAANGNPFAQLSINNAGLPGLTLLPSVVTSLDLTIGGGATVGNYDGSIASLRNLFIGSNSWFTASSNFQTYPPLTINATNVTIQPGGGIKVDGTSILAGGGTFAFTGGGGGNGGYGGASATNAPGGNAEPSLAAPQMAGGIGGSGYPQGSGGKGGGVVRLTVTGVLQLDGAISANGLAGVVSYSGGGAGGSIWLTVNSLSGTGIISANGGAGDDMIGGGGGGGVLAIYYITNQFSGITTAYGGPGANAGGAGIIYLSGNSQQQVVLDNGGLRGAATPVGSLEYVPAPPDLNITGGAIATNAISATLNNLVIGSNSAFLSGSFQTRLIYTVLSNATIQAGGSLTSDGTTGGAFLQEGQTLNLTGGGGSYGGIGGTSVSNASGGAPLFDLVAQPTTVPFAGAGGSGANQLAGGRAGGDLRIIVDGKLQLDGRISAEGVTGPGINSGGGAGGAIWLSAGTLSGSGIVSVNGGAANAQGGGGGGGRIALYYNSNSFAGSLTAYGGAGFNYGGAGTIYVNSGFSGQGTFSQLTVDNGGQFGNTFLSFYPPGNFIITGAATVVNSNSLAGPVLQNLLIGSNSTFLYYSPTQQTITVWTNATIQSSGKLSADGTSISAGGQTLNFTGGGGGHAGYGGASLSNALGGNVIQDSVVFPTSAGSRGGAGASGVAGGNGGGTLKFNVYGTLELDGRISADGLASPALNGGGGSGGAVSLLVGILTGDGTISANGGAGDNVGGGGGGGRISIAFNTNSFAGTMSARGGAGANYGGAGTIFTGIQTPEAPFPGPSQLIVDNGGARGTNTLLSGVYSTSDVSLTNGAAATISSTVSGPPMMWRSLTIYSNATLGGMPGSGALSSLSIQTDLRIQPGGAMVFDGDGFPANAGAGHGAFVYASGGGGGHGGDGSSGSAVSAGGGMGYDSIAAPSQAGSGGGSQSATTGSGGGGALQLTVGGTLNVDGTITANGMAANSDGAGGGSGGSLSLNVGTLSGSGKISADGGNGDLLTSGGGGGGCIALYFNTNDFAGPISARGGAGVGLSGGAGTIYLETHSTNVGQVIVDNAGLAGVKTPLDSLNSAVALVLRNSAQADSANPLTLQSLSISSAAAFNADDLAALNLTILGDALVDTNGAIIADAAGYNPAAGPGSGSVDGFGNGGGGGYGGTGGSSLYGAPGGDTYGSINQPVDFGSAGGTSPTVTNFSQGGGAIRLVVNGKLSLYGTISANGNDGTIAGAGGGSGGSIWITTSTLSGKGVITANGGAGESSDGGGGGGGRIAINPATNYFKGYVVAYGGDGAVPGEDGSILVASSFVISGSVLDTNGAPVAGVTLQPSGLSSVTSGANGFYSVTVPPIWSGSVTPTGNAFFLPGSLTYSAVSADATNQNFLVALPSSFNFTGSQFDGTNAGFTWNGINGVTYQAQWSSNMVDWAPYGPPILGTNGPAMFVVPVTNAPQQFFRLSVSY